jgi:23S rRNA (cytidine1920-2'-O)/16S rRNA (cytidine1409-2'-O)-methyltransferase
VDLIVADLSFISLRLVAPALAGVADRERCEAVLLVKPQFEAGREHVGRGGIVSDPAVHRQVLERVAAELAPAGLGMVGVMPSPIRGASGNVEFLGHFAIHPPAAATIGPAEFQAAVAEAGSLGTPRTPGEVAG